MFLKIQFLCVGQERVSDSLKLELQAVLRGTCVLGTKPRSSGKAAKSVFI